MIAKVFNHQLFWKKWKSIKSFCTVFKSRSAILFPHFFLRTMAWRLIQWKKVTESRQIFFVGCFLYATFSTLSFTSLCDKKRLFQIVMFFCLSPPKKIGNLRLNSILEGEAFCLQLKSKKQFFWNPFDCKQAILRKTKTVKTGFEEISETSINKTSTAPFLFFSHAFVTLSSYRAAMELCCAKPYKSVFHCLSM